MRELIRYIFIICAIVASVIVAIALAPSAPSTTTHITQPKVTTARLIFGGDFMQHMPQVNAARCEDGTYDYSATTNYIAPLFRNADIAVINLETTISSSGHYSGYPCFASPIAVVDALVDMGVDISLLANNHCCDRLSRGIESTIAELDTRNIAHTGVFRDSADYATNNILRFQVEDIRFALVNYTYGTNGITVPKDRIVNLIDTTAIKQTLRTIPRDSVDCVIACMHWGEEYERHPNRTQRDIAAMLRREGVDVIIGSHPHVVQPFEADSTHVIFYSLGNFVSNQRRRYTDGGLIAEVEVSKCDTMNGIRLSAKAHPIWVLCPGYKVLPRSVGDTLTMSEAQRNDYNRFMDDTDNLLFGE